MRQFIASEYIDAGGRLVVRGNDFTHLVRVLRAKRGDKITVRFPNSALRSMTLCRIEHTFAELCVCDSVADFNNSPGDFANNNFAHNATRNAINNSVFRGVRAREINNEINKIAAHIEYTLFQFVAKPQAMELIVRQAAECGVKTIVPVKSAYSQKSALRSVEERVKAGGRFEKIIKEAREQSGSPIETIVCPCATLDEVCTLWRNSFSAESLALVLSERTDSCVSLSNVAVPPNVKRAALVVGNEGGISSEERAALQKAGFLSVHIAGNILRCETAALYGIAALQTILLCRQSQGEGLEKNQAY